jgi:hypothetical protein
MEFMRWIAACPKCEIDTILVISIAQRNYDIVCFNCGFGKRWAGRDFLTYPLSDSWLREIVRVQVECNDADCRMLAEVLAVPSIDSGSEPHKILEWNLSDITCSEGHLLTKPYTRRKDDWPFCSDRGESIPRPSGS